MRLDLGKRVSASIRNALAHLAPTRELSDLFVALGDAARSKSRGVYFLIACTGG